LGSIYPNQELLAYGKAKPGTATVHDDDQRDVRRLTRSWREPFLVSRLNRQVAGTVTYIVAHTDQKPS
jgi:hypothetical protein